MQSEEQPVSDSNISIKSNLRRDWPPSFLRLVFGALFSAGLSYIVLKTMYPIFVVPPEIAFLPETAPLSAQLNLEKVQYVVDGKNFSVLFGVIGAIFGASCVVFSFGARSVYAIVIAVVGTAAMGCVGANLSNWMFHNLRETSGTDLLIMGIALDGMRQTILGYALLWGLIGLGVGLGIGAVRSVVKSLVAGISGFCGGVLAALLYTVLTAQLSRGTTMNRVFPTDSMGQAIWLLLFTVVIVVCIALGSGEKRRAKKA